MKFKPSRSPPKMSIINFIKKILKYLLPYEHYILTTRLTTADVYQRLSNNIEPEKAFRLNPFGVATKPYEGVIAGDTFNITRIIFHRNSFKPVITGKISSCAGKTFIKIKMRLHLLVLLFVSFWLSVSGEFCLIILKQNLLNEGDTHESGSMNPAFLPFIMFSVMLIITVYGFKTESNRSKKFFSSLLEEEKQKMN